MTEQAENKTVQLSLKRRPDESPQAYAAFKAYIDAGDERSLSKVSRKCKKHVTLLSRWSRKYHWQERLARYHTEQAEIRREAEETAALETARLQAGRRAQLQEDAWGVAQLLLSKAKEMLAFPISKQTVTEGDKTIIIMPGPWRFGDAARIADVADALGRLAVGLPSKVTELVAKGASSMGAGGGAVAPRVRVKLLTSPESEKILGQMKVADGS